MINKLSFERIVKSHFDTMRNDSSKAVSRADIFTFFLLPIIAGGLLVAGYPLNKDILNSIITSASIFAGLLLNLLVLIFSIAEKFKGNNVGKVGRWESKNKLLEQTFSNVSFCILLSVLLDIACMLAFRTDKEMEESITTIKYISDFIVYYLTSCLVLHLLMILKRIHALMESEL